MSSIILQTEGFVTNLNRKPIYNKGIKENAEPDSLIQVLRNRSQCHMVLMDMEAIVSNSNSLENKMSGIDDSQNPAIPAAKSRDMIKKVNEYRTSDIAKETESLNNDRKSSKSRNFGISAMTPVENDIKSRQKTRVLNNGFKLRTKRKAVRKLRDNLVGNSRHLSALSPIKHKLSSKRSRATLLVKDEYLQTKSKAKTNDTNKEVRSRSSTMPGLAYNNTMRIKAYEDGLDIAAQKSGRNIRSYKSIRSRIKSVRKVNSEQMYGQSVSVPDSLIQFVGEIHQESRITPQEEQELGSKTQEAIRVQNLYDDLQSKLNREPTDDEYCAAAGKINIEALRQTIEEGVEAKNRLVTSNLRMVQRVVNLYLRNGLGSEYNAGDLMQDGIVALIRAAEKFEPQRGFRFSTYAMYWIRSSVKRSQILQSRVIDVPQRLHEHYKKIQKIIKEYEEIHGSQPELSEIAEAMNLSEAQVERCIKALEQRIYSLDAEITNPLKAGGGNTKKETMYNLIHNKLDEETSTIEQQFLKEDLIRSLRKHLSPHEVDLLLLRYGLIDEKTLPHGFSGPLTISEVSTLVGIKPDKVRRMLNKSLRQLKHVIGHEWESETL